MPSIRAWQVMGWPVSAGSWAAASNALNFLALVAAPVLAGAGFAALGILVPFTDGVLEVFFVAMMVLLMFGGSWKPAPRAAAVHRQDSYLRGQPSSSAFGRDFAIYFWGAWARNNISKSLGMRCCWPCLTR